MHRKIFCTEYNIGFGQPRSDTCSKCDELKILLDTASEVNIREKACKDLEMHHRKAEKGYSVLRDESMAAKKSWSGKARSFDNTHCTVNATDMYTFDFEQNLPLPTLTHSDVFYCRQLWVYNFGVHDIVSDEGIMHVWDETTANAVLLKLFLAWVAYSINEVQVPKIWFCSLMDVVVKTRIVSCATS